MCEQHILEHNYSSQIQRRMLIRIDYGVDVLHTRCIHNSIYKHEWSCPCHGRFLAARLSAGDNATHKYFNAPHMLVPRTRAYIKQNQWRWKRDGRDGDASCYTIQKKFKFVRKFYVLPKISIFLLAPFYAGDRNSNHV